MRLLGASTNQLHGLTDAEISSYNILPHSWEKVVMRLLNTSTYQLYEITESEIPAYAILSHTWGNEEVSLQDFQSHIAATRQGFQKIKHSSDQAAKDDIHWIWIDTCCMNRLDSAERSQVLHSSYNWPENAKVCYAYLTGVSSSPEKMEPSLRRCKWFTRKWTLQELVAPPSVVFFAEDWTSIGTRLSLAGIISEITGIQLAVLTGEKKPKQCHVSERMAWASDRQATEVEDEAYALMGLFDIKLPILYGEGNRAFRRLQDEIRKTHYDTSRTGIRLLVTNSEPLEIKYFAGSDSPEYAILSHTWAIRPEEEVSFLDVRQGKAASKGSYQKVKKSCRLAAEHGFDYLWVDTCCIDKSSSAELQEAICSMYRWYKQAQICYVYLADYIQDQSTAKSPSFWSCRWFKRGWTLQELVAPTFVEFYDKEWNEIGTKLSLCDHISQVTSIDPAVLRGSADPTKRTIAERMSWAASRSTTRIEDTAYSLMGLFNVNMPMLYGEGSRAFTRLQEEIMKESEDYTIFAWKASFLSGSYRGLLAHSPDEFLGCAGARSLYDYTDSDEHPPTLTSRGLRISLLMEEFPEDPCKYLACVSLKPERNKRSPEDDDMLCVWLELMPNNVFERIFPDKLVRLKYTVRSQFTMKTVYVKPHGTGSGRQASESDNTRSGMVHIHYPEDFAAYVLNFDRKSFDVRLNVNTKDELLYTYYKESCIVAAFNFKKGEEQYVVFIGFQDHLPWCSVVLFKELRYPIGQSYDGSDIFGNMFWLFKWPYSDQTDRSSIRLSNGSKVTAVLRVGCPTKLNPTVFNLQVRYELAE